MKRIAFDDLDIVGKKSKHGHTVLQKRKQQHDESVLIASFKKMRCTTEKDDEIYRLRQELKQAKAEIVKMKQELKNTICVQKQKDEMFEEQLARVRAEHEEKWKEHNKKVYAEVWGDLMKMIQKKIRRI